MSKWQGFLEWQTGGSRDGNWKEMKRQTFRQFGSFGEVVEEIDAFMKYWDIHPDSVLIYKVWLVGRNKGACIASCANFAKEEAHTSNE